MELGISFWAHQVLKDSGCVGKCKCCRSSLPVFIKIILQAPNDPDSCQHTSLPPLHSTHRWVSLFTLCPAFVISCKEGEKGIESRTVFSASNSVFYGCIWNWYVFNGVILIAVQSRQNSLWFQRDPMFSLASPTPSILLELSFFSSLLFPKLWIHYSLPSTVLIFSVCTVTSCILFASYQFPNMPDRDGV